MIATKNSGHTYARESFILRRSHYRCFGGTGGCTPLCRGAGGVVGGAYGVDNISVPGCRYILHSPLLYII